MRTVRMLIAGDHFVTEELVRDALASAGLAGAVEAANLTLPWPLEPFGWVAEVDEASDVEDELVEAIDGVEVLVTQMAPVTHRVLRAATALKLVVVCRGGPVNVNLKAAAERGVTVCATPGRNAVAAAEHAVALLIATMRRIPDTHATVVAGEWRSDLYALDACGSELAGSDVGVVGLGAIGTRVARILAAFDARVSVHDPYAPDSVLPALPRLDLDELVAGSDVLTLHARLTAESAGMIDEKRIRGMRPGAVLVNTARGGLVDYDAVARALHDGHLGAAAFDVFDAEPLPPGAAIRTAPRVVLTPHLAGATRQTAQRAAKMAAEVVAAYVNGSPLPWMQEP